MFGIFLAAALFGGTVLAVTFLVGGYDHGVDHGDHGDHGHHGATDIAKGGAGDLQWVWMPLMSLRFWTFAAASFGLTGVLLSLLGVGDLLAALVATPFGVAIGYGSQALFRRLGGDQVSGSVGLERYVGSEAKVVLPVRPGDVGKIAVQSPSGRLELIARTHDLVALEVGHAVLITAFEGGTADVTRIAQLTDLETATTGERDARAAKTGERDDNVS